MSLAALPQVLADPAAGPLLPRIASGDPLSRLLLDIRVGRSLQYCFEPRGDWIVDASPAPFRPPGSVSFHIVIEGPVWVDLGGDRVQANSGDVLMFPRGATHFLGAGAGGRLISPGDDLAPPPWPHIPTVVYDAPGRRARILCGFLEARVLDFQPLLACLPEVMIARTASTPSDWLNPTIERLLIEIDHPSPGSMAAVVRLSEIVFIELLRRHIAAGESAIGWLAALSDPLLVRALEAMHAMPHRDWSQQDIADAAGTSKSVLCARFGKLLGRSPIRYLREWRLYLASVELADTGQPIKTVAQRAGYADEAAFTRAFTRHYRQPPAKWRQGRRLPGTAATH